MPPNWPTYAWYTAAAVLGFVGAFLLIKWLIGDRAKGRRRCPKCWYDMGGTPSLTCTECGIQHATESSLFRTRRSRLRFILCAVMLILCYTTANMPWILKRGWSSAVPSTLLLLFLNELYTYPWPPPNSVTTTPATAPIIGFPPPTTNPPPPPNNGILADIRDAMRVELFNRYQEGSLWNWQHRIVARRHLDTQIADALAHNVRTRRYWLEGSHMVIALRAGQPALCGAVHPRKLTLRADGTSSTTRSLPIPPSYSPTYALPYDPKNANALRLSTQAIFTPNIGTAEARMKRVRVDMRLEEIVAGRSILIAHDARSLPLESVTDPDRVLPPVRSDEFTLAFSRALRAYPELYSSGTGYATPRTPRLRFECDTSLLPPPESSALSLRIELIRDGTTLRTTSIFWPLVKLPDAKEHSYANLSAPIIFPNLPLDGIEHCSVRIAPDPLLALYDLDAASYREVACELPMTQLISNGNAASTSSP